MNPARTAARTALLLALLALPSSARAQAMLPPGFVLEDAAGGHNFTWATCFAFINDHRFLVGEQDGLVWVVNNGVVHPTPAIDLTAYALNDLNSDRGLLGIAVDPNFAVNRYVYINYTVDPDSNDVDSENDGFGRLVRYQMSLADSNVIDTTTRVVLYGRTWPEGPASGSITHTVGGLRWGRDGSLLVAIGDGAHYTEVDDGGLDPGLFGPGKTHPSEDIGAFRSQDLNSLCGKILRINPATGHGYPSNPYWDGNPMSVRSRVWAYGLRNPFRFGVKPWTGSFDPADGSPGTLYVVDVGWERYEELDVVGAGGGNNYGWPCFEGDHNNPQYQSATPAHHDCSTIGTAINPAPHTEPIIDWHHFDPNLGSPPGYAGSTGVGGVFYDGYLYPLTWRGAYFYGDYGASWIRALRTNANDRYVSISLFGSDVDGPVDFALHPSTRDIHYIAVYTGNIYRIRYTGTVDAPEPPAAAARLELSAPAPNPARGAVRLTLTLPRPATVRFAIHDLSGREVWSAAPRAHDSGRVALEWPGHGRDGRPAPPGLYLASVTAGGERLERRVIRLR